MPEKKNYLYVSVNVLDKEDHNNIMAFLLTWGKATFNQKEFVNLHGAIEIKLKEADPKLYEKARRITLLSVTNLGKFTYDGWHNLKPEEIEQLTADPA